jgi:hypothetical protein
MPSLESQVVESMIAFVMKREDIVGRESLPRNGEAVVRLLQSQLPSLLKDLRLRLESIHEIAPSRLTVRVGPAGNTATKRIRRYEYTIDPRELSCEQKVSAVSP